MKSIFFKKIKRCYKRLTTKRVIKGITSFLFEVATVMATATLLVAIGKLGVALLMAFTIQRKHQYIHDKIFNMIAPNNSKKT